VGLTHASRRQEKLSSRRVADGKMSKAAGWGGPRRRRGEGARSGSTASAGPRRWRACPGSAPGRRRGGSGPPWPRSGTGTLSFCTSPRRPRTSSRPRTRSPARRACRCSSGSRPDRPCTYAPAASTSAVGQPRRSASRVALASAWTPARAERQRLGTLQAPFASVFLLMPASRASSSVRSSRLHRHGATGELTPSRNQQICLPG